jgi:hypothetical protein
MIEHENTPKRGKGQVPEVMEELVEDLVEVFEEVLEDLVDIEFQGDSRCSFCQSVRAIHST